MDLLRWLFKYNGNKQKITFTEPVAMLLRTDWFKVLYLFIATFLSIYMLYLIYDLSLRNCLLSARTISMEKDCSIYDLHPKYDSYISCCDWEELWLWYSTIVGIFSASVFWYYIQTILVTIVMLQTNVFHHSNTKLTHYHQFGLLWVRGNFRQN